MDQSNYFTSRFSRLYKRRSDYGVKQNENKVLMESNRREKRLTAINARRNLKNVKLDEGHENILEDNRRERLLKWKKSKEESLQINKKTIKKPFVVGVVRHKIYSPITVSKFPLRPVRATRSTKAESARKEAEIVSKKETFPIKPSNYVFPFPKCSKNSVFKFKASHASSSKKLTKPISPKFMRREAAKKIELEKYCAKEKRNNENKKSSSDEELATPLSPPRVTRSRTQSKQVLNAKRVAIVNLPEEKIGMVANQRNIKGNNIAQLKDVASCSSAQEGPSTSKPRSMKKKNVIALRSLRKKNTATTEVSSTKSGPSTVNHATDAVISKEEVPTGKTPTDTNNSTERLNQLVTTCVVTPENEKGSVHLNRPSDIIHITNGIVSEDKTTVDIPMDLETTNNDNFMPSYDKTPESVKKSVYEPNVNNLKDTNLQISPPADFVLSPFVMTERGKKSARRSNRFNSARKKISLHDMPDLGEPDDGPTYQKSRLNKETSRLLTLAEDWEKIARLENLSPDIIGDIDLVVGQTKLLTRDKFQQFRNLIEQHEADSESTKVTVDDLNGFWDMMYLQVEDLNKKYHRLDVLKQNQWREPDTFVKQKSKRTKLERPVISAKSSIRDFIKRKKALSKEENLVNEVLSPIVMKRRSVLGDSPAAYNALRQSFTAKNFGTPPRILVTSSTSATPKSCLKIKPEGDTLDRSVQKTVNFLAVDFQDNPCKTPENKNTPKERAPGNKNTPKELTPATRRSTRLLEKNPDRT